MAYPRDSQCVAFFHALGSEEYKDSDSQLSARLRASLHRYSIDNGLLCCRTDVADTARIVVPHDDNLKYQILFEAHNTALSGNLVREKTYVCKSTLHVAQALQMGERIRSYMRNVPAGRTLSTLDCSTRQFTCAHGVLRVHQYGFWVWSSQRM